MKKTTTIAGALTVFALAACTKQENPVPTALGKTEIAFAAQGIEVEEQTKTVTEVSGSDIEKNGFKVVGVMVTGGTVLFNAVATKGGDAYKPAGAPYYYPETGNVNFYGVYPTSQTIVISNSKASLSYSQGDGSLDIVAAAAEGISKQSAAVAMSFGHILSQLGIKVMAKDGNATYTLNYLKINAPASGTYDFSNDAWTPGSPADISYISAEQNVTTTAAAAGSKGNIALVPSTVTLSLKWTCTKAGATVGTYERAITVTLTKGKKTTATLTLPNDKADEITFTVSVSDWTSEEKSMEISEELAI